MFGVFGLKFLSSVLALSSQCSLKGAICPYLCDQSGKICFFIVWFKNLLLVRSVCSYSMLCA